MVRPDRTARNLSDIAGLAVFTASELRGIVGLSDTVTRYDEILSVARNGAVAYIQHRIGRSLLAASVVDSYRQWDRRMEISTHATAITKIEYFDEHDTVSTLADTSYLFDTSNFPPAVAVTGDTPTLSTLIALPISVHYVGGDKPESGATAGYDITQAVGLLVLRNYQQVVPRQRSSSAGEGSVGEEPDPVSTAAELDSAVTKLLAPYRHVLST